MRVMCVFVVVVVVVAVNFTKVCYFLFMAQKPPQALRKAEVRYSIMSFSFVQGGGWETKVRTVSFFRLFSRCVREKTKKNGVFGLGFVFCNTSSATVAKSFLRSSIHIYYVLILLNWQHKVSRRRSRNEHDNTRSITPVHTFIHGQ